MTVCENCMGACASLIRRNTRNKAMFPSWMERTVDRSNQSINKLACASTAKMAAEYLTLSNSQCIGRLLL